MKRKGWSCKIVIRYAILQVAGLVAVVLILYIVDKFIEIALWLNISIILVWAIKDIILFPLVWRAYDWDYKKSGHSMIGKEGVATERIAPTGYILVRGELWKAKVNEKDIVIENGQKVLVHDVDGLTLHITPVYDEADKGI